jgi:hypothetical protein
LKRLDVLFVAEPVHGDRARRTQLLHDIANLLWRAGGNHGTLDQQHVHRSIAYPPSEICRLVRSGDEFEPSQRIQLWIQPGRKSGSQDSHTSRYGHYGRRLGAGQSSPTVGEFVEGTGRYAGERNAVVDQLFDEHQTLHLCFVVEPLAALRTTRTNGIVALLPFPQRVYGNPRQSRDCADLEQLTLSCLFHAQNPETALSPSPLAQMLDLL